MSIHNTIKIILADDHEIFRDGFTVMMKKQTGIELVAEARNGEQLLSLVARHLPDVVLTDIKMPDMDGIEATRIITAEYPQVGIIALSMFDDDNLIIDMLEAGAKGYLLKNAQKKEIIEAIKTVNRNEPYYCNNTSQKLARLIAQSHFHEGKPVKNAGFTQRELEIIQLICNQNSNKEISEELHLSVRTIEGYREQILEKTNAKNTVGIVIYAIRHHIYKP
ncbi:MAG: response regulator transcription factor [Sphingobacteriales bacterium]|nr:response regulator transcription factor [Sphingobacteriales bacterium]